MESGVLGHNGHNVLIYSKFLFNSVFASIHSCSTEFSSVFNSVFKSLIGLNHVQ